MASTTLKPANRDAEDFYATPQMTKTEKRIEMVKLLQRLKLDGEAPGDTVLRALRALAQASCK